MIDIHAHILPGIDDGVVDFESGVEVVRELCERGVTDVIATPHYISETDFVSPVADNREKLVELKDRLDEAGIEVNVYLGNEIYIDKDILKLIEDEQITPLANSKYLLIELPLNDEYPNYADYLRSVKDGGYEVVLAHPERYGIFQEDYELLVDLCEAGVLLQCNIGSICGQYGKGAEKLMKKIAKDKRIFAFGTDVHRPGGGRYLDSARKKLTKYYNDVELKRILVDNPAKIVGR